MCTRVTYKVFMVFMVVAMLNGTIGCDLGNIGSQESTDGETSIQMAANSITQEVLLEESETKTQILQGSLANQDVAWGHAWLEAQGYTYVDTNSLVLVEMEYLIDPPDVDGEDVRPILSKQHPDPGHAPILIRADTVVWQAFENPTHDSANHTALLTFWRNGSEPVTVMFELDVGQYPPVPVRQGLIAEGQFIPGDVGVVDLIGCLLGGLAAGAVYCSFTNGGWGHCMAVAAIATGVGCAVSGVVGLFFGD